MAAAAIGAGFYLIYNSPVSLVEADRRTRTLFLRRRGLLRREERSIPFADVVSVDITSSEDIDGDPVYSSRILLPDGTEERLTCLWVHDQASQRAVVSQLADFLSAPA